MPSTAPVAQAIQSVTNTTSTPSSTTIPTVADKFTPFLFHRPLNLKKKSHRSQTLPHHQACRPPRIRRIHRVFEMLRSLRHWTLLVSPRRSTLLLSGVSNHHHTLPHPHTRQPQTMSWLSLVTTLSFHSAAQNVFHAAMNRRNGWMATLRKP